MSKELRNQIDNMKNWETKINDNVSIISESSLNRILGKHYEEGFIIISSYRDVDEKSIEENNGDYKELKSIVKNNGFSFIPVYGGYIENKDKPNEKEVRESALLIPNYKVATTQKYPTDDKLRELGVELSKKYNQDTFLYKPMGDDNKAYYIDKNDNVDMEFNDKTINDLTQIYFTDLTKNKYEKNKTSKRFTFTETIFINKSPKDLNEAKSRYGELFFSDI